MAEIKKVAYCPHCGNYAPQKLVHTQPYSEKAWSAADGSEENFPAIYFVVACETCHQLLLYCHTGIGSEADSFYKADLVWPQWNLHSAVPRTVAKIYAEAVRIKSLAPNAFAVQIRRALEALCEDRGAKKTSLQACIKELADKGEIPPVLAEATDVLRLLGNVGAHAADMTVHPLRVFAIDDFFRVIVEYVYIAPRKLEEFKQRSKDYGAQNIGKTASNGRLEYYNKARGNLEYYHNKGEQDAAKGNAYSPPHGVLATTTEAFAPVYGTSADARAENEAYSQGWESAQNQKDG